MHVHVHHARGVVGSLDVPARPEQGLGDPAEQPGGHCSWPTPGPLCLPSTAIEAWGTGICPGAGDGRGDGGTGSPSGASIQVSLEPPPWLELTTSSPSGSATLVRPPGSTQTSSPSLTANGRRSMCLGTSRSPIRVGAVDRATGRCAIQPRGLFATTSCSSASVSALACGPITM